VEVRRKTAASGGEFVRDWRDKRARGAGGGAGARGERWGTRVATFDDVGENVHGSGSGDGESWGTLEEERGAEAGGCGLYAGGGADRVQASTGAGM